MGFNWDGETYTEGEAGGAFISEDEFNRLIYTDAVVEIYAVREGVSNYDPKHPKEQWLVDFIDPKGEERTKGITKGNAERDSRIARLKATLEANPDDPIPATPFKVGRRIEFGKPKVHAE